MHLSSLLATLVISLVAIAVATPAAVAPDTLVPGKQTCAVSDTSGRTLVFLQQPDNSVVVRAGTGIATNSFTSTTILAPNTARTGTPLACTLLNSADITTVRFYYIGISPGDQADLLHELVPINGDTTKYQVGNLDSTQGSTIAGTQYLYALTQPNGAPRLGFQCGGGQACEFVFNGNTGWSFNILNW